MSNDNITEALKEAYAVAPTNDVILDTLEFRHSSFIDETNSPFALRFVRDYASHDLGIEVGAPLNSGETKEFIACAFDVIQPPEEDAPAPELTIELDNIGRPILQYIDQAVISENQIEVTYRPYLLSDPSGPQQIIPVTFIVKSISMSLTKIIVKCSPKRIGERPFPTKEYSLDEFISLASS
ncbi:MAG: DUF1833 domain-containing protein [Lentisphaeraceae bacterium]|nr:DUF1833 domain-containing protein [Lentisphaeraceae bacterium]